MANTALYRSRPDAEPAVLCFSDQEVRKVFRAIDKNNDGGISAKELCTVMKKMGNTITESEARKIVQQVDKKGTGMITEDDFVGYMRIRSQDFNRELRDAFRSMDTDKSGFLTPNQLRSGFNRLGMTFSDKEFKQMLVVVDADKNGEISWQEFLDAMK